MGYRRLFLFVEGDDDARFFKAVIEPLLRDRYDHVDIVTFANLKKAKLDAFVRSAQAMPDTEYLIVRDLDQHPCVSSARAELCERCSHAEVDRIQVVKAEIESWYCAGIPEGDPELGLLAMATVPDTQGVTKEVFQRDLGTVGTTPLPLLIGLLERFDHQRAESRNASFAYFLSKHVPHRTPAPTTRHPSGPSKNS